MSPQITCSALYDWLSVLIILDSTSTAIVIVIVRIVVVVLPSAIILVPTRSGTNIISISATAV